MYVCYLFILGKILNDSSPLSDYNIQESNFIVVMVSKVKPTSDIPQVGSLLYRRTDLGQFVVYLQFC